MLVSNLTLSLWPAGAGPPGLVDVNTYFIQVTNLEPKQVTFAIECQISNVVVGDGSTTSKRSKHDLLESATYDPWFKMGDGYFTSSLIDIPANTSGI
jgi:hypothetical protein